MEALIETFHLDVKLIAAQLVNFLIVLAVLWYFALKPLMKVMAERTKTIEDSLKKAEDIEKGYAEAKTKEADVLKQAQTEAQTILASAKKLGEEERVRLKEQTKEEIAALVADAKKKIVQEKDKASADLKAEVADLVIAATEKVLSEKAPKGIDKKLIDEVLEEMT